MISHRWLSLKRQLYAPQINGEKDGKIKQKSDVGLANNLDCENLDSKKQGGASRLYDYKESV